MSYLRWLVELMECECDDIKKCGKHKLPGGDS